MSIFDQSDSSILDRLRNTAKRAKNASLRHGKKNKANRKTLADASVTQRRSGVSQHLRRICEKTETFPNQQEKDGPVDIQSHQDIR